MLIILNNATPKPLLALAFAAASLFAAPSYAETDAELMASGQWRDPATGLIWMRCSIGQKWDGKTCTGEALELKWDDAAKYVQQFTNAGSGFAGSSNWRLPKIEELVTLRRCSKGWEQKTESQLTPEGRRDVAIGTEYITLPNGQDVLGSCAADSSRPALDTRIFPNTPVWFYWSASPSPHSNNLAWFVYFYDGFSNLSGKYSGYYVRAVRAGQ